MVCNLSDKQKPYKEKKKGNSGGEQMEYEKPKIRKITLPAAAMDHDPWPPIVS